MIQTFESIEINTAAIEAAYGPTKIQLEKMLPVSVEVLEASANKRIEYAKTAFKKFQADLDAYYINKSEWDDYFKSDTLWNRLLGRVKKKPECVFWHHGALCEQKWYIEGWEAEYRKPPNKITNLLGECNAAMLPCEYSQIVQMNAEQLARLEYFRKGEALKEAIRWMEELKEQS